MGRNSPDGGTSTPQLEYDPKSIDAEQSRYSFQQWMKLQEVDLNELIQAQSLANHQESSRRLLVGLVQKSIQHFENYISDRSRLARVDVSPYFAPEWCTALENSLLWIGGCRPSIFIRCVYALGGSEIDSQVISLLNNSSASSPSPSSSSSSSSQPQLPPNGNRKRLGEISGKQLEMLNKLQETTIKEEEKLSRRLASLQEDIADQPIALVADKLSDAHLVAHIDGEAENALENHEKAMLELLEEADRLRLTTVKEIVEILDPPQAVEFLAGGKKLHLCMHEWGIRRDLKHGRRPNSNHHHH